MKKKKVMHQNYLDFIPFQHNIVKYDHNNTTGLVTLFINNRGLFHFLAQKFFKKPPVSQIHLDQMGSFLWCHIDGNHTIYDIAQSIKEQFGEEAEPLYNRLLHYLRTLESYDLIKIKKPEADPSHLES